MTYTDEIYNEKLHEVQVLSPFYSYGYTKEVLKEIKSPRKYSVRTVYAVKFGKRRNDYIIDALLIVGRKNRAQWLASKN